MKMKQVCFGLTGPLGSVNET